MQIETYKTPCQETGKIVASKWIAYVLRPAETGLLCTSLLMDDPRFEQAINDLRAAQVAEFNSQVPPDELEKWRTKEVKPGTKNDYKKKQILSRAEIVNDRGPVGFLRNTDHNVRAQQLVHTLMLTRRYAFTQEDGGAGKMVQQQLDKSILTDPDRVEKIKAAMKAFRDSFPPNIPLVLSFHLDKPKKDPETGKIMLDQTGEVIYENPHIHGWMLDIEWDLKKNEWGKRSAAVGTAAGLAELHKKVNAAILHTTGSAFGDQAKKHDPARPARSQFTKRQSYWTQQYRGRQEEFLSGKFLDQITNPYEKEAMRQFVEQRRYDVEMMRKANLLTQEKDAHRQELELIRRIQKVPRQERRDLHQEIEEIAMLMDSANNPSDQLQKMHKSSESKPGSAFKPTTGYYRTKQNHKKLSTNTTQIYDRFSEAAKTEEVKSIRESIAKIDRQLANTELNPTQRLNLEFTRDFEIKSLKYMKAQLPQRTGAVPVPLVAKNSTPVATTKSETSDIDQVPKL